MSCFVGNVRGRGDGIAKMVVDGRDTQSCVWRRCVLGGGIRSVHPHLVMALRAARAGSAANDGHLHPVVVEVELEADGAAFCIEDVRDRDNGVDGVVGVREDEEVAPNVGRFGIEAAVLAW